MQQGFARRLVEQTFDRLGYAIIPKWRMPQRPLALHLQTLFAQEHIDCVFDVGGNIGEYGEFLRLHVGYRGPIVSFEPTRQAFATLSARVAKDANWRAVNIGLAEANTTAAINVAENDRFTLPAGSRRLR